MKWSEAMDQLDKMDFPEDENGWQEVTGKESHEKGKKRHSLTTYTKWLNIGPYDIHAKYNYCKECREIRNKYMIMWNNEKGTSYQKVFTYHGKNVEGRDLGKVIKEMFPVAVIALLFIR